MTFQPNITPHDAAWAEGGRASDVPITAKGPSPFDEQPAEASPIEPNTPEIESFLRDRVGYAIHVVSIDPDAAEDAPGKARGRYFGDNAGDAARYLAAENASGRNCYWTVNVTPVGMNKKPFKKDIAAARFAHADIDPPKGSAGMDKDAALARLQALDLVPSFVIDSGNGLQPLWQLTHAPKQWEPIEDINRGIEKTLAADSCHNIDRLLRVPGTINWPNATKRARGRVPVLAKLAHDGGRDAIYTPDQLAAVFPPIADTKKESKTSSSEDIGDIPLLTAADLGIPPERFYDPLRSVIEHPAGEDRSKDGLRAAGDLLRAGFTKLEVLGILLNPKNKVSAHYLDQADPRRAAVRAIDWLEKNKDKANCQDNAAGNAGDDAGNAGTGAQPSGTAPLKYELLHEMADPSTPRPWIMKGIFAKGETTMWYGPPGGLKSALLASATVAVAHGDDWFGRKSKGKFGVIYFALERPDLVRRRLQATIASKGITEPLAIAVIPGIRGLSTEADVAQILATIAKLSDVFRAMGVDGVGMTIFDTWAKLVAAGGGDENSAKDVGPIFANLQRIKDQTGVHAALIGHTGKDKDRGIRGSSAIPGDFDVGILIDGDATKTATVQKANAVPEGKLFSFGSRLYTFGHDEDGDAIDVNIIKPVGAADDASSSGKRVWPKSLKLFRRALTEVTINSGVAYQIPQGPTVRSVKVDDVRKQYAAAYPHNGDGERRKAIHISWRRHFDAAVGNDLIGCRNDGQDTTWMWDAT
jgi:hypothetical protein